MCAIGSSRWGRAGQAHTEVLGGQSPTVWILSGCHGTWRRMRDICVPWLFISYLHPKVWFSDSSPFPLSKELRLTLLSEMKN